MKDAQVIREFAEARPGMAAYTKFLAIADRIEQRDQLLGNLEGDATTDSFDAWWATRDHTDVISGVSKTKHRQAWNAALVAAKEPTT